MIVNDGDGRTDGDGEYLKDLNGTVYVVAGSSGKVTLGTPLDHPVMFLSMEELGSLVLDVDGNRLDARFISDTGSIADYLTLRKGNKAPTVDTGFAQAVIFPASSILDGTVSDDDLPDPPAAVNTLWTQIDGSGTVTFTDATAVDTDVSFSTDGIYVLQLEASDGEFTTTDEITVTVYPKEIINQAPRVAAGGTQTITLPGSASLDGTVTDDGLPNPPGTVTTTWIQISGPGTVAFTDGSTVDTTASFSADGTYVLRLTANDGEFVVDDEVTLIVNPAPLPPPPPTPEFLDIRVVSSSDDAEEQSSRITGLTSSDLEMVQEASIQTVGMRFNGVTIPPGATITSAHIQFQAEDTNTRTTTLMIQGQAVDDTPTFSSTTGNISSRTRTTASTTWSPPAWNTLGEQGPDQQTPDISAVIQEIIDRSWLGERKRPRRHYYR